MEYVKYVHNVIFPTFGLMIFYSILLIIIIFNITFHNEHNFEIHPFKLSAIKKFNGNVTRCQKENKTMKKGLFKVHGMPGMFSNDRKTLLFQMYVKSYCW